MACLGVFALIDVSTFDVNDISQIFIAFYMILFAFLLFLYELMWWLTIDKVNVIIRRNFGFLYGIRGKALYLIFVACLCIGLQKGILGNKEWLRYFVGIAWLCAGCLHIFLFYWKSDLLGEIKVPTGGFDGDGSSEPV